MPTRLTRLLQGAFLGGSFLASLSYGQGVSKPAFEVAEIHRSGSSGNPFSLVSGGILRNGRYDVRKATMLDLIRIAWEIDADKVVGGPSWLALDRFDISAKAAYSTPTPTVNLMLRALLADRFKLVLHSDTRPLPAYVLTGGKDQPKLRSAESPAEQSGCRADQQSASEPSLTLRCRNATMADLAGALRRIGSDYLPEVLLDSTGIDGGWDFDIHWNPRWRILQPGAQRVTIFDAIEQQLGLRLERRSVSVPVLVVDHVDAKATPNLPDVTVQLPPRSVKFDVATIKLSLPDAKLSYKLSPAGQVEFRGFVMRDLISEAWDIDWNHMDERIVGAPKWIDSRRYDVVAKTGAAAEGPRGTGFMDDDLRLMLRTLLTERFGIESHYEDRPVQGHVLTAAKPRLRKADPANRANCKQGGFATDDPRDRNPALSRLIQCQNVTMAQFAEQLQRLDPGQFATNGVSDETRLKGAWDFQVSYSARALLQGTSASGDGSASEPNGAISLVEALRQQLGLRLETRKRPMPVLVIEHMADTPAEN